MNKSAGFTLLEVLIAMIVLAIGLLGLAGLQATSLKNNQSAYNRSVATQLAYEIADRMRANYTEAKKLEGNVYTSVAPDKAVKKPDCLSKDSGCLPADMAQNDLYEWNQALKSSLPNGTGTIAGNVFTVTISWTENRDENNDGEPDITRFQMSFQL